MDKARGQVDLTLREHAAAPDKLEAGALVNGQITHVSGKCTLTPCASPCKTSSRVSESPILWSGGFVELVSHIASAVFVINKLHGFF